MEPFTKDPDAVLDYKFDWSAWLASGETIDTALVVADTGIVVDSFSIMDSATAVMVWLSGGAATRKYIVTCRITTSAGRIDDRSMIVTVAER